MCRNHILVIILIFMFSCGLLVIPAFSQQDPATPQSTTQQSAQTGTAAQAESPALQAAVTQVDIYNSPTGNPFWTPGETTSKTVLRYSILVGAPVITFLYGAKTWNWGDNHDFWFGEERWFQGDTGAGGADKIGHCFAHYAVSRMTYSFFSYTEQSRNTAVIYSGLTAALIGTMIEIGDGFTGRYGFSYEDLVVDYVGIIIAMISDRFPIFDQFIGFTATYVPSKAFRRYGDGTYLDFAGDYSGWKYMFNFKLGGFKYIGLDIPEFMRYVQFDIGYYTRQYTDYDHENGDYDARRHWFFGISVNMREVARDLFSWNRKAQWLAEQPFQYYHVPIGYQNDEPIGQVHDERGEQ